MTETWVTDLLVLGSVGAVLVALFWYLTRPQHDDDQPPAPPTRGGGTGHGGEPPRTPTDLTP